MNPSSLFRQWANFGFIVQLTGKSLLQKGSRNDDGPMELTWIEDFLPPEVLKRKMFGGRAYYLDEKLVLVTFESLGNKEHRGQVFDFEIWNGCMFPVEKSNQPQVLKRFPFLIIHPVLAKWLYLPAETEDFESQAEQLLREIRRHNPLFGTIPKPKKSGAGSGKKETVIMDTRRPRMFADDPVEEQLQKARRISDLKNLGPETEKDFLKAGLKTAQQVLKMGWKKTMIRLCESDPKNNHSIFAYAVIGAVQGKMWHLISEDDKAEARKFMKQLRQSAVPKKAKAKNSKKRLSGKKRTEK